MVSPSLPHDDVIMGYRHGRQKRLDFPRGFFRLAKQIDSLGFVGLGIRLFHFFSLGDFGLGLFGRGFIAFLDFFFFHCVFALAGAFGGQPGAKTQNDGTQTQEGNHQGK
jgi:hypothetical protein